MAAFFLQSSKHSNNRHSIKTPSHNPIHYLKPVHLETKFVPKCLLEPCCSLRLFMVVTWHTAFSLCMYIFQQIQSRIPFYPTAPPSPRFAFLVWCLSPTISTHRHPHLSHNSQSLSAMSSGRSSFMYLQVWKTEVTWEKNYFRNICFLKLQVQKKFKVTEFQARKR